MYTDFPEIWIQSITGGFYLNEVRAWKYEEGNTFEDLQSSSKLHIFLKSEDNLTEIEFQGIEADSLLETVREFKIRDFKKIC